VGLRLTEVDEGTHDVGSDPSWNESRYVDFWDSSRRIGGWLRIGMRPNEGRAEVTACVYLPHGRTAFAFRRAPIDGNGLSAGGQSWEVVEPFERNRVRFDGDAMLLTDPWLLTDPAAARASSRVAPCSLELDVTSRGLAGVMGADQDDIGRIFLPGQADLHYQHLAWTTGQVRVGDTTYEVDGAGGRDHSWGARNWLAKIYLRWHTCVLEDGTGFMLMRAVGPTKQTRSGHVWSDGRFHLVDDFSMRNHYDEGPYYALRHVELTIRAAGRVWTATGTPATWLPLRHRHTEADGSTQLLRIVKSPTDWVWGDGRVGAGAVEYHDRMESGVPVGLHD